MAKNVGPASNKQSEQGMSHAKSGAGGKSAHSDTVGSSGAHGIRFPVHDYHGVGETDAGCKPKSPERK